MSQNNLELGVWGDGTIRLAFWDFRHGDDVVFVLNADGTAQRSEVIDEGDDEALVSVDLVQELRALAQKWDMGVSDG